VEFLGSEELDAYGQGIAGVTVKLTRVELAGLANALLEASEHLEDWEFDTRVGLLPEEAQTLCDSIRDVLHRTEPPQ
jgi:hypothetical protein